MTPPCDRDTDTSPLLDTDTSYGTFGGSAVNVRFLALCLSCDTFWVVLGFNADLCEKQPQGPEITTDTDIDTTSDSTLDPNIPQQQSLTMGTNDGEEERSDFTKIGNVTIGSIAGDEARQGTEREHSLSLVEAVKLYPTAVGWSIYFSLGVS